MKSLGMAVFALVVLKSGILAKTEESDLGLTMKQYLIDSMDYIDCFLHGNNSNLPKILGDHQHRIKDAVNNYMFDFNISNLQVYDIDKFEVINSEYNKETMHYKMEMKFKGPRVEGIYSFNTEANESFFGLDLESEYNFTLYTFPTTFKMDFILGTNETTSEISFKDLKFEFVPIKLDRLKFGDLHVGDHFYEIQNKIVSRIEVLEKEFHNLVTFSITRFLEQITRIYDSTDRLIQDLTKKRGYFYFVLHSC
ncbi:hypothetical protein ACFFRR_006474 [Megaselia abdita]